MPPGEEIGYLDWRKFLVSGGLRVPRIEAKNAFLSATSSSSGRRLAASYSLAFIHSLYFAMRWMWLTRLTAILLRA